MITLLDHMREEGFVHTGHLVQPLIIDAVEDIVPGLIAAGRPIADEAEGDEAVIERL